MGDAVLADPQGKRLLVAGVRLNQAFNDALDIETFECSVAPRPVVNAPIVTTHDMSKLVDAWIELVYNFLMATGRRGFGEPQLAGPNSRAVYFSRRARTGV